MRRFLFWFICWNLLILLFMKVAILALPLQNNYLGGAIGNYLQDPLFWAHANYDGDHYIEIARHGYGPFEYFYFPLFPLLLKTSQTLFQDGFSFYVLVGVVISIASTFIGLNLLRKLMKLDKVKSKGMALLLLMLFPTSFYFQMVYTEAIFFAVAVAAFYYARKDQYLLASLFAGIAASTKVIGLAVVLAIFIEWLMSSRNKFKLLPIVISPVGIGLYMRYLWIETGDPLVFIHRVGIFGDQRSAQLILLPQVFYRYFIKILPNLSSYWPASYTILLELSVSILFLLLLLFSFRKIRFSYWVYSALSYFIPTLSGSFSSMPRYVLILFPMFIFLSQVLGKLATWQRTFILIVSTILLGVSTALFTRGYWLS